MSRKRRSILIAIAIGTLAVFLYQRASMNRRGPDSPGGDSVTIHCRDAGIGPGADYYADVSIKDSSGNLIAQWKDTDGQESKAGFHRMVESMEWTSPEALRFTSYPDRVIRLRITPKP